MHRNREGKHCYELADKANFFAEAFCRKNTSNPLEYNIEETQENSTMS